jgi:hypothetical protein
MVLAFVAIAAAVGYVACLLTPSHRTPYDRWSDARVVRSGARASQRIPGSVGFGWSVRQ